MIPLDTLGTAAGLGAGGVLGHLSNALSAPRRGLMSMLGLPESGSELLGKTFGMDQENPLTKALGIGAEALFDPLTYLGGIGGGALGKLASGLGARRAAQGARIGEEVAGAATAQRAATSAVRGRELGLGASESGRAARLGEAKGYLDPTSMASGASRTYARPDPALAAKMEELGIGSMNPQGGFDVQAGLKRNLSHANELGSPGVPPPFAQGQKGGGLTLVGKPGMQPPTSGLKPEELSTLGGEARRIGPENLQSIHDIEDPFKTTADIMTQRERGSPLSTMRDILPTGGPVARGYPAGIHDLPIDEGVGAAQSALIDALNRQGHFNANNQFLRQLGMTAGISGAAGVGYGAGQQLFNR